MFYDQLQSAIDHTPSNDVLLVNGDLNARTVSVNTDKQFSVNKDSVRKKQRDWLKSIKKTN